MDKQKTKQLESLLRLVSPRTGLIRSLARVARSGEEPHPPIIYQAQLAHFDFRKGSMLERGATGKGETAEEAQLGAIGEAVERYCAYHPDASRFRQASYQELSPNAIPPTDLVLYSERQYMQRGFRYPRFDESSTINWIEGLSLPDRKPIWLPASLVYLNYFGDHLREFFCPPTSNGMAAGPDLDSAILGGLSELVERDAFMLTWMNRLPAPRIENSQLQGRSQAIIRHYARSGVETYLFNLTTDLPAPVMMAIGVDRSGRGPAAVVGLGCHLDPAIACRKALFELCQVRPGEAARFTEDPPRERPQSYRQVRTLEDHSAFFTQPEQLAELDFLLKNSRRQTVAEIENLSVGNVAEDLATMVGLVSSAGSRSAYAEITTPDLESFGVRVVHVLATGLQPIHFGYGEERLGSRRLFEIAQTMGVVVGKRTEDDLNPCPHPLA